MLYKEEFIFVGGGGFPYKEWVNFLGGGSYPSACYGKGDEFLKLWKENHQTTVGDFFNVQGNKVCRKTR